MSVVVLDGIYYEMMLLAKTEADVEEIIKLMEESGYLAGEEKAENPDK